MLLLLMMLTLIVALMLMTRNSRQCTTTRTATAGVWHMMTERGEAGATLLLLLIFDADADNGVVANGEEESSVYDLECA